MAVDEGDDDLLAGEPLEREMFEEEGRVLQAREVGAGDNNETVGGADRGCDDIVEGAGGIEDDDIEQGCGEPDEVLDLFGRAIEPAAVVAGGGEDAGAGIVAEQHLEEGLAVERFHLAGGLGDAVIGPDIHHDGDIAEAGIKVDEEYRLAARGGDAGGQVGARGGLADAAFLADDGDDPGTGLGGQGCGRGSLAERAVDDGVHLVAGDLAVKEVVDTALHEAAFDGGRPLIRVGNDRRIGYDGARKVDRLEGALEGLCDGDEQQVGLHFLDGLLGNQAVRAFAVDFQSGTLDFGA